MINELLKKYEDKISEIFTNEYLANEMWKHNEIVNVYREILKDLNELKENASKNYDYCCGCETCIAKNDLLDEIIGTNKE